MDRVCYVNEWLVEESEVIYFSELVHLAQELDCELFIDGRFNDEGYRLVRFILSSSLEEKLKKNIEQISNRTIFNSWIKMQGCPELKNPIKEIIPTILGSTIDALVRIARINSRLREQREIIWFMRTANRV